MDKICLVFNTAPIYRKGIYELIGNEYDCVWAIGHLDNIKDLDKSILRGEVIDLSNVFIFKNQIYWQKGALKLAFRKDIDQFIILGESRCLSVWALSLILRLRKKKVAFWSHGWYGRESGMKKFILRLFWSLPTKGLIYNNHSRNIMEREHVGCQNYTTIYNSLDYDSQIKLRRSIVPSDIYKDRFCNDYPTIVFIGRLVESKKLDLILDALKILKDKNINYNLCLIGDGPIRTNLENKAREMGIIDKIWFYGQCYDEAENAKLIYNADLCVSPGNIGLTAIHCMMFGTLAITHNLFSRQGPEFETIIPGKTGDFFEHDNVEDIARSIEEWTKNHNDREVVRRDCYSVIDTLWNPHNQIRIIRGVLAD